jgi:hypothetical protein
MQSAPEGAAAQNVIGRRLARRIPYNSFQRPDQPDNWQHLGDIVARIVARRYDLSRQHAHIVVENHFGARS